MALRTFCRIPRPAELSAGGEDASDLVKLVLCTGSQAEPGRLGRLTCTGQRGAAAGAGALQCGRVLRRRVQLPGRGNRSRLRN